MFFEVLSLTYHSPITIDAVTQRVLLGIRQHRSRNIPQTTVFGHGYTDAQIIPSLTARSFRESTFRGRRRLAHMPAECCAEGARGSCTGRTKVSIDTKV